MIGTDILANLSIEEICQSRDRAIATMRKASQTIEAGFQLSDEAENIRKNATLGRKLYGHSSEADKPLKRDGFDADNAFAAYKVSIDKDFWHYIVEAVGVKNLMDREAHDQFYSQLMQDPPEATEANVRATIQSLFADRALIFQRGLVNCFCKLSRRFKSHDGFKIGSRIVVERAFSEYGGTSHDDVWRTIADVERVMAVLDGENPDAHGLQYAVEQDRRGRYGPRQSKTESRYFRIDGFKNGNAHLWFTRDDLVKKANLILADHYGEVLPDAYAGPDFDELFAGTAVAKDLQFYRSPDDVVAEMVDGLGLDADSKVLEPSAGDGSIALAAMRKGSFVRAIEIDTDRCDLLRARKDRVSTGGMTVEQRNFLTTTPEPIFDYVLMNPPFYGTHYMDHVMHAAKFLAPGGILRAVLPASAEVNESRKHTAFRKWASKLNNRGWWGPFQSLPPGSFAASGTNIQTVILEIRSNS